MTTITWLLLTLMASGSVAFLLFGLKLFAERVRQMADIEDEERNDVEEFQHLERMNVREELITVWIWRLASLLPVAAAILAFSVVKWPHK